MKSSKTSNPKTGKQGSNGKFREKGDRTQGRQRSVNGDPFDADATKRDSTKDQRRMEDAIDAALASRSNPLSYYTKYSKFVLDAAKLPFAKPVGTLTTVADDVPSATNTSFYVPGVATIDFVPAIGVSSDFSSAINRSSIRFYTYLRSNQKASAAYDHQDITMMEVAMDSCYMYHGLMRKIYSVVNSFTPVNEYYSRCVIAALGVDFDDIKSNLQDFRAYINAFGYSLGQYALPKGITLFDRHRWMVEGIYTDSESVKAQSYMFVPQGFWQYDNTVSTGSQCVYKEWLGSGSTINYHTFAQMVEFGDGLLNAVSNEEDFSIISGDIYNFYGGSVYTLPYVDENFAIVPTYDKTVLSQIENATIVGPLRNTTAKPLVISQNPSVNAGAIIFEPWTAGGINPGDTFMNFHWDSPEPGDVIEASRLMVTVAPAVSGQTGLQITGCGTEICTGLRIWSRNPATGAFSFTNYNEGTIVMTKSSAINDLTRVVTLAQCDWAPNFHIYWGDGSANRFIGMTWDIDNFDQIPKYYLDNIHLGCLLSLFEVGTNTEENS